MGNITLKQLAELTNLSVRTVGRVLNGSANVTPDKRERVLLAARKHHYVPNMAARNLRLKNRSVVGILCGTVENAVSIQRLHDLEGKLELHGFYPLLGYIDATASTTERIFSDWSGMVDYVAVMRPGIPEEAFRNAAMEFIFIDENKGGKHHCIEVDRGEGVCEAFRYLLSSGRKRILRCGDIQNRADGIRRAFEHLEHPPELLHFMARPEFNAGFELGEKILASGVDAVFFDTDRMAAGFLAFASRRGVRIPEDVAVIGFDNEAIGTMIVPELSTVAHPIEEINSALVEIILNRPEQKIHRTFGSRFIQRKSS